MLSYFPTPYPDELFYSTITRYHIRSGNLSFNQTLLELLGYSPEQFFNLDLPNNLEYLVKHLPAASMYCSEVFIEEHTLYPFYRSFLKDSEAWVLKKRMQKKRGNSIFAIAKVPLPGRDSSGSFLRYCPACLQQDLKRYGEPYWHRMHQVPGMLICTDHHVMLRESAIPVQEGYLNCHAADLKNCSIEIDSRTYSDNTVRNLLAIAQEIDWLMKSQFSFQGLQWLRNQYQHYLVEQGFLDIFPVKTFKFCKERFVEKLLSFYGEDYLNLVKPGFVNKAAQYSYRCLLACDVEPAIDRVTHILLIKFLVNSLKDFFEV